MANKDDIIDGEGEKSVKIALLEVFLSTYADEEVIAQYTPATLNQIAEVIINDTGM